VTPEGGRRIEIACSIAGAAAIAAWLGSRLFMRVHLLENGALALAAAGWPLAVRLALRRRPLWHPRLVLASAATLVLAGAGVLLTGLLFVAGYAVAAVLGVTLVANGVLVPLVFVVLALAQFPPRRNPPGVVEALSVDPPRPAASTPGES
jgi:hypothetical protein